jgi:predicted RNA binding protein YcfA (HicA-like mRNA interferase family)
MQKPISVASEAIHNATANTFTCLANMKASDVKKLCEKHGFKLMRCKKHFVWKHPSGASLVTSKSASDYRALANIERNIKRLLTL